MRIFIAMRALDAMDACVYQKGFEANRIIGMIPAARFECGLMEHQIQCRASCGSLSDKKSTSLRRILLG